MNADQWKAIRGRGLRAYLLRTGLRHIGIEAGFIFVFLKYVSGLWPQLSRFSMHDFLSGYLIWWPLSMLLGVGSALLIWMHFDSKYREDA